MSEIIFRVDGRSQPVTVDDALDVRGRLVERTLVADELRSAISAAIRRAESGERPAVDITAEMRAAETLTHPVGCINSATRPDMLVCRKIAFRRLEEDLARESLFQFMSVRE